MERQYLADVVDDISMVTGGPSGRLIKFVP